MTPATGMHRLTLTVAQLLAGAALTGRHTHLPCLLFSPIDWLEARLRRRG